MNNITRVLESLKKARPPISVPALEQPKGTGVKAEGTVEVKNKSPMISDNDRQTALGSTIAGADEVASAVGDKGKPYGEARVDGTGGQAYVDSNRIKSKGKGIQGVHGVEQHEAQHQILDQLVSARNFDSNNPNINAKHAALATSLIHKADLDKREMALLFHVAARKGYDMLKEPDEMLSNLVQSLNSGYHNRYEEYKKGRTSKFALPSHETFASYSHGLKQVYNKIKDAAHSYKTGEKVEGMDPSALRHKYGATPHETDEEFWSKDLSNYPAAQLSFRIHKLKPKDSVEQVARYRSPEEVEATSGGGFDAPKATPPPPKKRR